MSDTPVFEICVTVEDANPPPADYTPARKVSVEIHGYNVLPVDLEGETERAGSVARAQVDVLLGRTPAQVALTEVTQRRTRRTKEQIAADNAAAAAAQTDPTSLEDPTVDLPQEPVSTPPATSSGDAPTATTTEADPTALDDFTVQPEPPAVDTSGQIAPISDGDLNAAVQKRNGELGSADGTKAIRALIATYNPDPTKVFQLREVPADRRAEFINKLNAIKV